MKFFSTFIPFWGLVVGLLLVLGLWTRVGLVAGALLVAAFVFGTALRGDHSASAEQLIYALIFLVLLLFRARYDRFGNGWRNREHAAATTSS